MCFGVRLSSTNTLQHFGLPSCSLWWQMKLPCPIWKGTCIALIWGIQTRSGTRGCRAIKVIIQGLECRKYCQSSRQQSRDTAEFGNRIGCSSCCNSIVNSAVSWNLFRRVDANWFRRVGAIDDNSKPSIMRLYWSKLRAPGQIPPLAGTRPWFKLQAISTYGLRSPSAWIMVLYLLQAVSFPGSLSLDQYNLSEYK